MSTLSANVARIAKEYLTPVLCYNKIPYDAMKLNPAHVKTPVRYSFLREVAPTVTGVQSANLQEQPVATLDLNENQVRLPVKPNEVRTILFRQ